MTIQQKLSQRNGGFALKMLIHLSGANGAEYYLVNDTQSVTYDGHVYSPAAFSYTPSGMIHGFYGGGKLSVSSSDIPLVELVESCRNVQLEVKAVLSDDGIHELNSFFHAYGSAQVQRGTVDFDFEKDDRLSMTFPTLLFTSQNNRGNL